MKQVKKTTTNRTEWEREKESSHQHYNMVKVKKCLQTDNDPDYNGIYYKRATKELSNLM
jgi:hypothetical protein